MSPSPALYESCGLFGRHGPKVETCSPGDEVYDCSGVGGWFGSGTKVDCETTASFRLGALQNDVDGVYDEVSSNMDSLSTSLNKNVKQLRQDLSKVKDDLATTLSDYVTGSALTTKLADYATDSALTTKLADLETKLADLQTSVGSKVDQSRVCHFSKTDMASMTTQEQRNHIFEWARCKGIEHVMMQKHASNPTLDFIACNGTWNNQPMSIQVRDNNNATYDVATGQIHTADGFGEQGGKWGMCKGTRVELWQT